MYEPVVLGFLENPVSSIYEYIRRDYCRVQSYHFHG